MDHATAAFLEAASVPLDADHRAGDLVAAEAIRAAHPEVADGIHGAAALGDDVALRRLLASEPALATARDDRRGWDPLTWLCFSRYLRLDHARSDAFVRAAEALLDAGADPNAGWWDPTFPPHPQWEPVLYGAAGVAHHEPLTRLLLARGADPDAEEVVYHAPETLDNGCVRALVETGRLAPASLSLLLLRKHDWHDGDGLRWLLARGADPNVPWKGRLPIHHATRRDNALEAFEALLDHGADPLAVEPEADDPPGPAGAGAPGGGPAAGARPSAVALAARRGRGDVLALYARRGLGGGLRGADRLLAACAAGDAGAAGSVAAAEPAAVAALIGDGATAGAEALGAFAGAGNAAGVALLLGLGVPVDARLAGDGYWDVASEATALHVAAWRARHDVVRLLLERGADPDARDGAGRTPLMLAVRACVDSYWTRLRSPESVRALLAAGAVPDGPMPPSGYGEVDALLADAGI